MAHIRRGISRRSFVSGCVMGSVLWPGSAKAAPPQGPAQYRIALDDDWLFGGIASEGALQPSFDDHGFTPVTLPHCVTRLSWRDWDPAAWEKTWVYRRHLTLPREFSGRRIFLRFEGVMTGASPAINGHALPEHLGAYLPFRYEITDWTKGGDNVLAVKVDSRWLNVPPDGSPKGPASVDYLEPGGIYRPVSLCAVPQTFISDVFAKPVNVLESTRQVDVACTIDAAVAGSVEIKVELLDGARVLSRAQQTVKIETPATKNVALTLANLGNIALWNPDRPRLYDLVTTLLAAGKPVHEYRVRIGFREARFAVDGFFLNGERFRIFGLDRHELYPYVGAAMPRRVLRRDAEILRHEYNCNMVRCSHYPQSETFLDACDELGLMVWEETPGWGYLGDDQWQELVLRDVKDMVARDRNHAAVIIWGVRVNESRNDPALYKRTRDAAYALDGSRPTSGSMTPGSMRTWREEWHQDVFAFDDYHSAPDGGVGILAPLAGVPYMLAEVVGQFSYTAGKGFNDKYRRAGDLALQQAQAVRHAQAHDRAAAFPRCCGAIAWCAFDYGSLINADHTVKCPGVADVFRIPKLGASFYQAQVSPQVRPVILPNFYWDFGPASPTGPGKNAAIFSNCDRLEISVGGKHLASVTPDRGGFPHLAYPPSFCDLAADGKQAPELRIDGYVGERLALSRSFSSDRSKDRFAFAADDHELEGDGSDATRLVFQRVDRFGALRPFDTGEVTFSLKGPGVIVGDNPFRLADSGGAGAIWVKTLPRSSGTIVVTAAHSSLGQQSVAIKVRAVKHA